MAKILVIDDDQSIVDFTSDVLKIEGHEILASLTGKEGLELAHTRRPDLILCDIEIPDINGHQILLTLRNEPATAIIPFIFLTANAQRKSVRMAMELGADDYLTKPFTPVELMASVYARLAKLAAIRREYQGEMESLRSNIIWALPHELRTPLAGIVNSAQVIKMDCDRINRQELLNLTEIILRSTNRLEHLIENHLLYAQLELMARRRQNRLFRKGAKPSPARAIADVIYKRAAEFSREGDLYLDLHEGTIPVEEEYLRKIVDELIDNAFKFSEQGTRVIVETRNTNDMYTLRISDEGRGMSEEEIQRVGAFAQFQRVVYEQQGVGLGLVISKRLTELHGGEFRILSANKRGTTIEVKLPLSEE